MTPQTRWIGGSYEAACGIVPSTASQILAAIKIKPGSTVGTIADMTGINISTVKNSLPRMEKRGEARKLLSTRYRQRGATRVAHWFSADHPLQEPT
jgi:DNA-binding MarR family transcriptional regulator